MIATDDSPDGERSSTSHNLGDFSSCIPSTSGLASVVECDLVQEFPPVDYQLPITSPDVFIHDHSRSTCLQEDECSSQLEFSTVLLIVSSLQSLPIVVTAIYTVFLNTEVEKR